MSVAAWIILYVLASIALGAFLGPRLRAARDVQTTELPPPVHQVRDEQLDITPAIRRDR